MMSLSGLFALSAWSIAATVPEVFPAEETPAPQHMCPEGCDIFYDGCNICSCSVDGKPMACTRKLCTVNEPPFCKMFKENMDNAAEGEGSSDDDEPVYNSESAEDTSPAAQCPRGCTSWYDGCNDCSCAAPGRIGACTKRACVTKAEEKCTSWEPEDNDYKCPADCTSFFDGCNTCKCVNGMKTGCTRKYCPTKEEPKCVDDQSNDACPADCSSFFDGCNTCRCVNGKKTACTKKACLRKGEPTCKDADLPIDGGEESEESNETGESADENDDICPADCGKWFDGCNTCACVNGKKGACTKKYCPLKEEAKCLDAVVPEPEPKQCPEGCKNWFDGCNKCRCSEGKAPMCTRKMCMTYDMPKCMDGEIKDEITDIIRMTFQELQKFCYINRENSAECTKACGKMKKGACKGYKKAKQVKCKKITDMGFCSLLGCNDSGSKCKGQAKFAA